MQIAEGDSPALSSTGQLAYVKDGQIWSVPLAREKGRQRRGNGFSSIAERMERRSGQRMEHGSHLCQAGTITA